MQLPEGDLVHRVIQERFRRTLSRGRELKQVETGPAWHRGLSLAQLAAAHNLSECLRDDIEQRTTYRMSRLLDRLGVHPKPGRRNLRLLRRMSRGNDLAFLWFLMELCYKTEAHGRAYDINEQIIMSSIFWLDLYPTLRELDRVLPLSHGSAADRAKAEARRKQKEIRAKCREEKRKRQNEKSTTSSPLAPYFQEPTVPVSWNANRTLLANYPDRPALLQRVPQETALSTFWSRWFGDFNFSEAHRVTRSILYAEIKNIFESLKAAQIPTSNVASMCDHHRRISEMEASLKLKLEDIKKQQCQELATARNRGEEKRRKRVLEELEQMTNCFQAQFHQMAVKTRLSSTRKQLYTGIGCGEEAARKEKSDFKFLSKQCGGGDGLKEVVCLAKDQAMGEAKNTNVSLLQGTNPILPSCPDFIPEQLECANCELFDPEKGLPQSPRHQPLSQRPSSLMQFLKLSGHEQEKQNESSPAQALSHSNSIRLFKLGPSPATDIQFNYRQLFNDSKTSRLDSEQMRLKAAFVRALDDDFQYLNAALNGEKDDSLEALVDRAARGIFKKDTEMFDREYARVVRRNALNKEGTTERLNFGQKYYDPANLQQMKEMLRQGLERVGQDRRYVLPTLPDVHSVPYLIEWICFRYGKRYSQTEREHSFRGANFFMEHLALMLKHNLVKPPKPYFRESDLTHFGSQKVKRLGKYIKQRYTSLFVESIMEVGRVFYSAMRPQLCNTPPVSTFYAYMPAKYNDTGLSIGHRQGASEKAKKQHRSSKIEKLQN